MCIRDRYQRRVHGQHRRKRSTKTTRPKPLVGLVRGFFMVCVVITRTFNDVPCQTDLSLIHDIFFFGQIIYYFLYLLNTFFINSAHTNRDSAFLYSLAFSVLNGGLSEYSLVNSPANCTCSFSTTLLLAHMLAIYAALKITTSSSLSRENFKGPLAKSQTTAPSPRTTRVRFGGRSRNSNHVDNNIQNCRRHVLRYRDVEH
eukprot:TRINITY_DN7237_c0_g1_i3.p1 TRINITY_DN7237_c0_g1~~TRINITY_DN7237_c0_g1_i3.p1  ORF type:complete len:201 (-),score=30.39 TRINITY_DN7237_c0_g1_i3:91-693(-)